MLSLEANVESGPGFMIAYNNQVFGANEVGLASNKNDTFQPTCFLMRIKGQLREDFRNNSIEPRIWYAFTLNGVTCVDNVL